MNENLHIHSLNFMLGFVHIKYLQVLINSSLIEAKAKYKRNYFFLVFFSLAMEKKLL